MNLSSKRLKHKTMLARISAIAHKNYFKILYFTCSHRIAKLIDENNYTVFMGYDNLCMFGVY